MLRLGLGFKKRILKYDRVGSSARGREIEVKRLEMKIREFEMKWTFSCFSRFCSSSTWRVSGEKNGHDQ
jgi:hypothetical protein